MIERFIEENLSKINHPTIHRHCEERGDESIH
jgi:hypothetical protein